MSRSSAASPRDLTRPVQTRGTIGAIEPLAHVSEETWLRLLAVAHDVDAGFHLLAHALGDRAFHALVVGAFVVGETRQLRLHQVEQIRGPRQAADVGREDAVVGAVLHLRIRLSRPATSLSRLEASRGSPSSDTASRSRR